jgi:outer membrane protein
VSEGEVSYYETRQALALAMGNDSEELVSPPFPEGDFPAVIDTEKIPSLVPDMFIKEAKKRRLDYLAALTAIEAEEILLKKALNEAKPKLDFTVKVGYAGISEEDGSWRYFDSIGERMTGVNGFAGLNLELPIANNAANGQIAKQNASVRKARLSADASLNSMTSEILRALESIKGLVNQYDLAAKSEEAYKNAVVFENRKYDAGESSLNALIDIENKYINARLSVIETIRKYAIAITRLKFLTGSLLEKTDRELVFSTEKMMDVLAP